MNEDVGTIHLLEPRVQKIDISSIYPEYGAQVVQPSFHRGEFPLHHSPRWFTVHGLVRRTSMVEDRFWRTWVEPTSIPTDTASEEADLGF